jgi:hypothetical protein
LVVSEDPKIPPEATDPAKCPLAFKKKKPKMNNAGKGNVITENPSTPHLDDVSLLLLLFSFFLFNNYHLLILLPFYASRPFVSYNKGNARHGYSRYQVPR